MLAKEVVQSRKAVNRLYTAKANLSSVELQMKQQLSQLRVAGSLQQSTEVMKAMQQLVKLPELQKTMMELSKEMMKVQQKLLHVSSRQLLSASIFHTTIMLCTPEYFS